MSTSAINLPKDAYEIKKATELIHYLGKNGIKEPHYDFDFQLPTNYGFVFNLKNKEVVFIPNNFRDDGIIFKDKKAYQVVVDSEFFPLENPQKSLYDIELHRIKSINQQVEFYHNHLNKVLKFDFTSLNIDAAQAYMKKIIGRKIKKLTTETDLVALIAVIGELLRQKINGNWVIEKWYGTYNPYFMPRILNPDKKIIHINDYVLSSVKWNVADAERLVERSNAILTLSKTRLYHECIILE